MSEFLMLGLIGALLGIFYRNCLKSRGMIFNYIYYGFLKPIAEFPRDLEEEGFKPRFIDKLLSFIMYPLGYCMYCSTFWITLFICIIHLSTYEHLPSWQYITLGIVAAEGVQHFILMCTCRYILDGHPDL